MSHARDVSTRLGRRFRTFRARARHRFGMTPRAPRHVGIAPAFVHPIALDTLSVADYKRLFPTEAARELREAERLADHRFSLLSHDVEYPGRIPWSRDPVSGRDWPLTFSADIRYRGDGRLGDIKLPWELNKHQYFFTLGKAAWLRGSAEATFEILRQIEDWIATNPFERGIHWISALETGTRAVSWILAYPFYADHCSAEARQRLAMSIAQHLLFVEDHLSVGPFANTHLVGEAAVLVIGGLFVESRHSARWLATGLRILETEIERQVTKDGVHVERSPAYHRFFLDHYYLVGAVLAANQRSLSSPTLARMQDMTAFVMRARFPDGTMPDFGDADAARGLWLRSDAPHDYTSLLALGAVIFDRHDFRAAAANLPEEVMWLLGLEGVRKFQALQSQHASDTSTAFPDGGYYVLRSGWHELDACLVFDCGPLGFGPAGHGHADALSFQLHCQGYPFLVDPGTFSYNLDYGWREAFRSTRAHNTVVVDGLDQSVPGDRMSWRTSAQAETMSWMTTPWFDLVHGSHNGYRRLADPVTHERAVVFLKPDVWVIWDVLTGAAQHEFESLLHLRPDCGVEVDDRGVVSLVGADGRRLYTWMAAGSPPGSRFQVIDGTDDERAAWFSPTYGTRVPSRALRLNHSFRGRCGVVTCLAASHCYPLVAVQNDQDLRVQLTRGVSEDTLFYSPSDRGRFQADGIEFVGSAVFHGGSKGRRTVAAQRCHQLLVEGLLEVTSSVTVHDIVVDESARTATVHTQDPGALTVVPAAGLRVVVNGLAKGGG